jgi:RNA-binding motif protein, X-linked 2
MNALTQIKNTQKATRAEIELGIGDKSSWHSRFKHSAYVYAGGLPFELTEGDILAVFSQYGEVVDIHLVRDKKTGKSRGFAFLAYEDQRSTVLAVDNLSGARVTGRTIRVEHVDNYRKKRAEVEGEPIPEDSGDEQDEEAARAQEAPSRRGRGEDDEDGSGGGGGGAVRGGGGEVAAWSGGNSMFDLMAQAKAQGLVDRPWKDALANVAGGGGGSVDEKGKEKDDKKKERKEKKEKRHKHKRSRSRSRSPRRREHRSRRDSRNRSRSRSRDRERRRYEK